MRRQTRDKKQHIPLSVLIMLDEGFTYEVISVSLGIDSHTVGITSKSIFRKDFRRNNSGNKLVLDLRQRPLLPQQSA